MKQNLRRLWRIARRATLQWARQTRRRWLKRKPPPFRFCRTDLVFLHIPKTAGTSVSHFLLRHYHPKNRFIAGRGRMDARVRSLGFYYSAHATWDRIDDLPGRPQVISFLRDPEKRLVSLYNFLRQSKRDFSSSDIFSRATRKLSFNEWLVLLLEEKASGNDNAYLRVLAGAARTSRLPLISDQDAVPLMELAKRRIDTLLVCGIVERHAESMALIAERLGLGLPEVMERKNVTPTAAPQVSNARAAEAMAVLTRFDRQLYDYAFAKLPASINPKE